MDVSDTGKESGWVHLGFAENLNIIYTTQFHEFHVEYVTSSLI